MTSERQGDGVAVIITRVQQTVKKYPVTLIGR